MIVAQGFRCARRNDATNSIFVTFQRHVLLKATEKSNAQSTWILTILSQLSPLTKEICNLRRVRENSVGNIANLFRAPKAIKLQKPTLAQIPRSFWKEKLQKVTKMEEILITSKDLRYRLGDRCD
jgi:hypothetical protein